MIDHMNIGCSVIAIAAILAAYFSSGDKAFGFWVIALFAMFGAAS